MAIPRPQRDALDAVHRRKKQPIRWARLLRDGKCKAVRFKLTDGTNLSLQGLSLGNPGDGGRPTAVFEETKRVLQQGKPTRKVLPAIFAALVRYGTPRNEVRSLMVRKQVSDGQGNLLVVFEPRLRSVWYSNLVTGA